MKRKLNKPSLISSHDKKVIPVIVLVIFSLTYSPQNFVNAIVDTQYIKLISSVNPFVDRMASQTHPTSYGLFCYGLSFLLVPFFFHVLLHSESLKQGRLIRYQKSGKSGLLISAIGMLGFFMGIFFLFKDFTPGSISNINYIMFYSRIGIATFSVLFTYFLTLMIVCSFQYFSDYFNKV